MPPKQKKNEELVKRREAQKICKRRRYAEIKNDPELLEIEKRKRRERYLKQKESKKEIKKSVRAQKEQKKKWRENSKRYRQKKKQETVKGNMEPPFPVINIQAVSSDDKEECRQNNETEKHDPLHSCSQIKSAIRKIRYTELKKRKQLLLTIAAYKKRDNKQRKHIQRLKDKLRKTHLVGIGTRACNSENTPEIDSVNISLSSDTKNPLIESVKKFYTEDSNSTISSCKREYITRNKERKQKRYLCLPLKELYKKFLQETKLRICYSFFCKLRPFWVCFPKNTNRETCQCTIHVNMELLISALHNASVIREKNCEQVLQNICCDSRNIDCLRRNCDACKSFVLNFHDGNKDTNLTYFKWGKVTKDVVLKNGLKKKQIITEKKKVTASFSEAIAKTKVDLEKFLEHTYKIVGQYRTIRNLKENLNIKEALVHVDFSENYSLKYAEEVQPFHFGGSRQQVSLHTAVIYTHSYDTGVVTPTSMCTLSACLRHDAAAIWAHLVPLIEEVLKLNPLIDTIHFLSDSPSSQYRNKTMFYIITNIHKDFQQLNTITWNYSESGHGKGAPDGIGATLKRTADKMVLYGEDVGTFDQFYNLIKRYVESEQLNIKVKKVEEKDILLKSSLICDNIKTFKGTLSVHQVLWEKAVPKVNLRKMSCFECSAAQICVHGHHLGTIINGEPSLKRINVLSDITLKVANIQPDPKPSCSKDF